MFKLCIFHFIYPKYSPKRMKENSTHFKIIRIHVRPWWTSTLDSTAYRENAHTTKTMEFSAHYLNNTLIARSMYVVCIIRCMYVSVCEKKSVKMKYVKKGTKIGIFEYDRMCVQRNSFKWIHWISKLKRVCMRYVSK